MLIYVNIHILAASEPPNVHRKFVQLKMKSMSMFDDQKVRVRPCDLQILSTIAADVFP